MDKKSELASSLYFSDNAASLSSSGQVRKRQRQSNIKVQIVNQNLEEAIKEVRKNVKENPEWNLNVKPISHHNQKKKESMAVIN
jgi:oligoribonuclease NrnB/cAMP/cGMP phosphodiesterase (DHH superfamily)